MVFDLAVLDWTALGTIATFLAVLVALFLPVVMELKATAKIRYSTRRALLTYLINLRYLLADVLGENRHLSSDQFQLIARDTVHGIETVYWNGQALPKNELRLIGNLIIMISNPRFIFCRDCDLPILKSIAQFVDKLIQHVETHGIRLTPTHQDPHGKDR